MNHDMKLQTRAPRFGVFRALLLAVALLAVGLCAPRTRAVTGKTPGTAPAGVAASPAPLHVRKIVCHAHTITVRWSPGRNGRVRGELRRGELFTVLNKHDNVWFYGISNRGMSGWVLAEYLCDLP